MTLEANVFLSLLFLPNLQWITSCLLHAHLSHLATRSPKLEDPEPTVVLSFRSLSHVWIFCNSMDCSLPGFSVHGISQASIPEWVAIPFSRGSSLSRDGTRISCIAGRFFTAGAARDAHLAVRCPELRGPLSSPYHLLRGGASLFSFTNIWMMLADCVNLPSRISKK